MPRQDCQVPLQLVVYCLLDRSDGKSQSAVSHLASFSFHLCWFHIDEALFFQLANVLGNGVGAHAGMLANPPNAGPALVGLPVLKENQVGVERHLLWGKPQGENGVGQKKKSSQRAAAGVSVLEFRGVPSPMAFKDSTPMFWPMSIEKSKFTVCSQYIIASVFRKPFTQPFSLFTPPQILRGPSPLF